MRNLPGNQNRVSDALVVASIIYLVAWSVWQVCR